MTTRLEDKRIWLAGGCAVAVLIAAVGWLVVIGPQFSSAKTLRSETDSARVQNAALTAKVAKLKLQNDKVGALRTSLRVALDALPFDSGLPAFTRQLARQATGSGVVLSSISVGSASVSTAGAGTAGTTAPATTAAGTTATGTTSTGTTATGTTATGTTSVAPSTTIMTIPITLLTKGSSKAQLAFLEAIQVAGPRRALVSSTNLSGAPSIDKSATMTTQLNVFLNPLSAAAQAELTKLLSTK